MLAGVVISVDAEARTAIVRLKLEEESEAELQKEVHEVAVQGEAAENMEGAKKFALKDVQLREVEEQGEEEEESSEEDEDSDSEDE